jgi:hypothetical protein
VLGVRLPVNVRGPWRIARSLICPFRQVETLRAVFSINRPLAICLVWCRVGKLSAYDDPSRLSE